MYQGSAKWSFPSSVHVGGCYDSLCEEHAQPSNSSALISKSVYKVLNSLFFSILHLSLSCMGSKISLKFCFKN